jgi:hypothetical protein
MFISSLFMNIFERNFQQIAIDSYSNMIIEKDCYELMILAISDRFSR